MQSTVFQEKIKIKPFYTGFLDENRIFDYKKFINSIPPNRNIGVVYRSKEIKKNIII